MSVFEGEGHQVVGFQLEIAIVIESEIESRTGVAIGIATVIEIEIVFLKHDEIVLSAAPMGVPLSAASKL